jgi:hypothetical protein
MTTMTYCKFENTLSDLGVCVDAMEQAKTLADLEMNEHEAQAFHAMWRVCRSFLAEHDRLIQGD